MPMGMSAVAHGFGAMNEFWNDFLFRLDRSSISACFAVISYLTGHEHFLPRREFRLWLAYQAMVVCFGLGGMTALFKGSKWSARSKSLLLIGQMACGCVPVLRELFSDKTSVAKAAVIRTHLPLSAGAGVLGALCFSTYWPEAFSRFSKPGRYDVSRKTHAPRLLPPGFQL